MSNQQQATEFKNKGNQAFKAKHYQEAIDFFTKAIQLNPNDHVFFSNRSGAYLNNEQHQEALQDAETCIKMNPTWPRGYQRKGTAQFYLQQFEDAINTYKEGLKHDPNNAELQKNLKDAEANMHKDSQAMMNVYQKLLSSPDASELLGDPSFLPILQTVLTKPQEAGKYMQDARVQKLMKILQSTTSKEDMEKAAKMYMKQKSGAPPEEQKQHFKPSEPKKEEYHAPPPPPPKKEEKKPQKMEPQDPAEQAKNKGNEQFKKKHFNEAINYYQQAIQINPNEPLYYNNKAAALIEQNELESALEEISKAEKLFEEGVVKDFIKKAKVLARKGTILAKQQKYSQAITAFEKSLVEDNNQKVKDDLTKYKKVKQEKEAKEYINPQLAEKHNELGTTLYKDGKFPQSLKEYQEAIRRNPENAKFYSNVGQVYIKLMEFQRAKENYDLALKKDPTFQKAYYKKGDCHFFLKEYYKAQESYKAGLKQDPNCNFCQEGLQKTQAAIYTGGSEEDQKERARKAMADPEIQAILQTPEVRNALADLERDPKSIHNVLKNKNIAEKLEKLISAGVIRMG